MCSSGSSPWIPGSRFPLSVNVSTCHHAAVSSQQAGFFWNIQRVAPPTQLSGGRGQHRWRGRQQVLRAFPSGDKRQLILHCENALLCQCSMLYDLDIAPPPPLQTHRNTAAVKPQPEVTLQVKSFSPNLRSTVKVATMRLQGPHAIYRDLALRIPSSHPPPFIFSPPADRFFPCALKAFLPRSNWMTNTFRSTAMWPQGRLVFCSRCSLNIAALLFVSWGK